MNDTIAIIPARSGSKSIKDKNIKLLCGHPLISYSIIAAKLSKKINRVIVSTDSEEYAEIASNYGAEVPFIRPSLLSSDASSDREFLIHAMKWLKENENSCPEFWVHLRPTTPLREPNIVDKAIDLMYSNPNSTSLRSGHKAPESPLKWFIERDGFFKGLLSDEKYNLPKESFEDVYIPNGYVDILKSSFILKNEKVHGDSMLSFISPVSTEVDSIEEFDIIEYQINKNKTILLENLNKVKR